MSISAYKEITEWDNSEFKVPNHTYLFDGKSNIFAYAKESNNEVVILKTPLKLDTRRRKFEKVKHKNLEIIIPMFAVEKEVVSNLPNWQVKSDSGKIYTVELNSGKYICGCIGYSYRGKCKHSEKVKNEQIK